MPLIKVKLLSDLVKISQIQDRSSAQLMKIRLMSAVNSYASKMYPPSSNYSTSKLIGLGAFRGDQPSVPKSFSTAFGKALGAYSNSIALGKVSYQFLPSVIPNSIPITFSLMSLKSVTDTSELVKLSNRIHSWITTGVSILTIPPTTYQPTPWI